MKKMLLKTTECELLSFNKMRIRVMPPTLYLKNFFILPLLFFALSLSGCITTKSGTPAYQPLSPQQRASMQTKELEGSFDTGFTATLSVLQDQGWQIDVVDKESGIIQASSLKRQNTIRPADDWYAQHDSKYIKKISKQAKKRGTGLLEWTRWEQITVHIEPWGRESIRERITITKVGSLPSNTYSYKSKTSTIGAKEQSVIIENPATYQYLFQQIQRSIFIRQGLTNKK
jgi:hypothetical protein